MRKTGSDKFFEAVSKEANYMDQANLKPVYYSILRAILAQLKEKGAVVAPDWGEFRLIDHKARKSRDPNNPGGFIFLPPITTVKFSPCGRLKNYAKTIGEKKRGVLL